MSVIVRVITQGNNFLYYTGNAGKDWLSEDAVDAFEYSPQAAALRIEQLYRMYAGTGLDFAAVPKPDDLYFSMVDNCGDEIEGCQNRGGLSLEAKTKLVNSLAKRYGRTRGQGKVIVRNVKTWQVLEEYELPS